MGSIILATVTVGCGKKDGEGMTGMQKTAYEAVKEVAANILSGKYGKDDDIDIDALEDDLEDATADLG